jgi:hypothetical protein
MDIEEQREISELVPFYEEICSELVSDYWCRKKQASMDWIRILLSRFFEALQSDQDDTSACSG